MKYKIDKVGFEIEGEFSNVFLEKCEEIGSICNDGSVHKCNDPLKCNNLLALEFNSNPEKIEDIKNLHNVLDIFQDAWEHNKYHNNNSCGFHIHFSFFPKRPPELLSIEFYNYFVNKYNKKYPNFYRIREMNTFCKKIFDESDIDYTGDRYKAINFIPSLNERETIEFRIFPAVEPKFMKQFLNFTIKIINKFSSMSIVRDLNLEIKDNCDVVNMSSLDSKIISNRKYKQNIYITEPIIIK
jgi:hypothetical protein